MTATAEAFFKPERISPEVRLMNTNDTVKSMLAAEAAARAAKTEKLRVLRLAHSNQ